MTVALFMFSKFFFGFFPVAETSTSECIRPFAECKPPLQVHFTTVETEYCIAGCAICQPIVFCQPALLKGMTLFALFLLAFTETLWSVWHILKNMTTLSFAVMCTFNILLLQAR